MATLNAQIVELCQKGIDYLINNDWEASEKHFEQHKLKSPVLFYLHTFITLIKAGLYSDQILFDKVKKNLDQSEKLLSDSAKGLSLFRNRLKKNTSNGSLSNSNGSIAENKQTSKKIFGFKKPGLFGGSINNSVNLEEKLTKAIALADCKACLAAYPFIRQETPNYLVLGLQIKRSWKIYSKLQRQLYALYKRIEPNAEKIYGFDASSLSIQLIAKEDKKNKKKNSNGSIKLNKTNGNGENNKNDNGSNNDHNNDDYDEDDDDDDDDDDNDEDDDEDDEEDAYNYEMNTNGGSGQTKNSVALDSGNQDLNELISHEAIRRLLGAVSFGFGLFQVILSLIPPNFLKLVKLLGFEGDRGIGLKAIMFSSNSKDMRAPLADMVLLWYSTIATPMYGFSENDLFIRSEDLKYMIDKNTAKYPNSSLFYYFKGKYYRFVKNIPESLKYFEISCKLDKCDRHLEILSLEQTAWLHLMNLNYTKSLDLFSILSKESKWSAILNTYICALLCGTQENFYESSTYVKLTFDKAIQNNRDSFQYDLFALKRCQYFRTRQIMSTTIYELLVVELLLLWICLPYCDRNHLKQMLDICDSAKDLNLKPTKSLMEGVIHSILNNDEQAEISLKATLIACDSDDLPFSKYVLPYTHYHLSRHYTNKNQLSEARIHLTKALDGKDFELENRIQTQMKSLQRRLKYLSSSESIHLKQLKAASH